MPNAISNRGSLTIVEETVYGSTLASTTGKQLRITGESIEHSSNRAFSDQIDPGRNRVELVELSKSAAGGFENEMSYTDFVAYLIAILGAGAGAADTPAAGTTRYTNASVLKSYYIEKKFADIGAFIGVRGACFSELTLDLTANERVKAQWSIMAQKTTDESASRFTAVTPVASDPVMRCGFDVAAIELGGSPLAAAVQQLTLKISNNIRPTTQLSADSPTAMQFGAFEVTGTMRAYFPSKVLYQDMLTNTARSLKTRISNSAGAFGFYFPAIKLADGTPKIPGQNQDVMQELNFSAQLGGSGEAYTMALDVTPAV